MISIDLPFDFVAEVSFVSVDGAHHRNDTTDGIHEKNETMTCSAWALRWFWISGADEGHQ
jgi:hypothetical protein